MKAIHISGRRWFEKTNGNTYCSVRAWIDGELEVDIPYTYGYGSFYKQAAHEELVKLGKLPGIKVRKGELQDHVEPLWQYCDRLGIKFVDEVVDVPRKKDL